MRSTGPQSSIRRGVFAGVALLLLIVIWLTPRCSRPAPTERSESEIVAQAHISKLILVAGDSWYGLTKPGSNFRVIEMKKPHVSLSSNPVSETDKLNGVTARHTLTIYCQHHRTWDGRWSEWQQGIGGNRGAASLAVSILGFGDVVIWMQQKKGVWYFNYGGGTRLEDDAVRLQQLVAKAVQDTRT